MQDCKTTLFYSAIILFLSIDLYGHGTVVYPSSRVWNIKESGIENPNFQLARNATQMDSKNAYYTWNQVSRNIPEAVTAGLPAGFDYSPWVPNGQLGSGGNVNDAFPLNYAGLDQVSSEWPTTDVQAGDMIEVDFFATAPHNPSVWDVWMTTADWDPNDPLTWDKMEFIGRPTPLEQGSHYLFDIEIPSDRSGHHVLWIAWQRDDTVGEVFFSTSDLMVAAAGNNQDNCNQLTNSTFNVNTNDWISEGCDLTIDNGLLQISNISVTNQTPEEAAISQTGISLNNGIEYVLEYQAHAATQRTVKIKIENDSNSTIYELEDIAIETSPSTYAFTFINDMPNTTNGNVSILLGGLAAEVTLDNITLSETVCITSCFDQLNLATTDRPEYHAKQVITCNADILNTADINLKAGGFLELTPSFEIALGGALVLQIEDCIE